MVYKFIYISFILDTWSIGVILAELIFETRNGNLFPEIESEKVFNHMIEFFGS